MTLPKDTTSHVVCNFTLAIQVITCHGDNVKNDAIRPVVNAATLRRAFEMLAKERWGSRLDAVIRSRQLRSADLAALADTTPQTIDKIRSGDIVPRDYLRFAIAMALGCEVDDIFPMPTRQELHDRAGLLKAAA